MFRARLCALSGFALMLAAASVNAGEVALSVDNRIGGDSNVFRTRNNKKADGFYELSPLIIVREQNSDLDYSFKYRPTYQTFFETSGIDGFDHRADGVLEWRMTPADTFDFRGSYSNYRTLRVDDVSGSGSGVPSTEESDRERISRGEATAEYTRMLSPVLSLNFRSGFDDFASDHATDLDSRGYSGQVLGQYALDPRLSLGVSGGFRRRETQGNSVQYSTDTDVWETAGFLSYLVSPTVTFSAQVGPSFVNSKQKPPTAGLPTVHSTDVSYFAVVELEKDWQRSKFSASYTRSESRGGGESSSAFVDYLSLDFNHSFDRRWNLRLYGSWTQRREIASIPGGSRQETTVYRATTTVTRRLTGRVSIIGQYAFSDQNYNQSSSTTGSVGTVHTGFISLRYTFEPIPF